ncbi:MAG: 50S ribosomal protein L1 [Candidatus Daviesbacteria bacterium]|nr:50S ribosomal protein L1 [Candidatus Daviesbacteria bacterium]
MGQTKTKFIDDSEPEKAQGSKLKAESKETGKTVIEVLPTEDPASQITEPVKKIKASKAKQKQGKAKYRSKKYQEARAKVNPEQKYKLDEAVKLLAETSYSKFGGTIEAHINTNTKSIRGFALLPFSAGKKLNILVFGASAEIKSKNPDLIFGDEELIATLALGKQKIDFDVVVTTPEWMLKLAKAAKILGPRGLMPSPKNDTVTDNLEKTIAELQSGKTEYKNEPTGQVIHLGIGKVAQPADEIVANIKALYNGVGRGKITKISLSSTMGPAVKLDLTSFK